MDREGKGHGIRNHIEDYCIVDLETTGIFVNSARIVEISAIRVRDNRIVEEYSTLVNPECHIPAEATAVNNITDEMIKDAPVLNDVIDAFIQFVGSDVIIGYNNAGFDMNIIYDSLMELRGKQFSNNYIDLLHLARRCLPNLENRRLETVSNYFSLDTIGEHRALKDCYLTKEVYDLIYKEFGNDAFGKNDHSSHHYKHYSTETVALQELQSLLEVIISDGQITVVEFLSLKNWMENHRDLQGNYPFDRVFNALDKVLEDGRVEPEELQELQILFSDFVDPVKTRSSHEMIESISGKHIVVTGDFNFGSRDDVFNLIEAAGGITDKGVKKATDYVVVGSKGSENWKTGNYGSKIQRAMELIDKGESIEIVEEAEFIPALQRIIENGVIEEPQKTEDAADPNQWIQEIRKMLTDLIKEYELPDGSLYLSDNFGQKENTKDVLISHSVCIWEPDYPPIKNEKPGQNKLVATIVPSKVKSRPDELEINLRASQEGDLHDILPSDAELLNQTKSDKETNMVRVRIKRTSSNITEYIRINTIYCIKGYVSKASRFGCCSSFERCSNEKRCVHPNKLYSKACMYRAHLDEGRIFYGKNRNVD